MSLRAGLAAIVVVVIHFTCSRMKAAYLRMSRSLLTSDSIGAVAPRVARVNRKIWMMPEQTRYVGYWHIAPNAGAMSR